MMTQTLTALTREQVELQDDARRTALPASKGTKRYIELDALRGLAALTVVFAHFSSLWDQWQLPRAVALVYAGPLQLIKAAHSAVVLFFVLSGFVLSLPLVAHRPQSYGVFLVRRITRVYLPYLAALTLAVSCDALFRRSIYLDPWFSRTWTQPVNVRLVLSHVLMLGNYNWSEYNTAFWSLVYEMRVSLVFPFLAALALFLPSWIGVGSIVCCFVVETVFLPGPPDSHTLFAFPAFLAGILLARDHQRVTHWLAAQSRGRVIAASGTAYACYAYGLYLRHLGRLLSVFTEPVILSGAVFLVVASLSFASWRNVLQKPVFQWLGHISYSMYLVHGTVLFSLVHLLFGRVPLLAIFPVFLLLTFSVSRLFYAIVERPAMNFGRRLTIAKAS